MNQPPKRRKPRKSLFPWDAARTMLEGKVLEVQISPWYRNIEIYHGNVLVDFVGASPVRHAPPKQAILKIAGHKIKVVNPPGVFTKPIIFVDGQEARLIS